MTPKGKTNGKEGQLKYFEGIILRVHIGKSSLVKYSIEGPHKGLRTGKGGSWFGERNKGDGGIYKLKECDMERLTTRKMLWRRVEGKSQGRGGRRRQREGNASGCGFGSV
jgi:hypothetical protein